MGTLLSRIFAISGILDSTRGRKILMDSRKKPQIPPGEEETVRRRILALLEEGSRTAREISAAVHIPEKEVADHLVHLRRSLRHAGKRLEQLPAECLECGFVFRKRDRPTGPGRCPVCRGEFISAPAFRVAF
jgi:predicted Zn-ribbon and HTH transcriptional regulator